MVDVAYGHGRSDRWEINAQLAQVICGRSDPQTITTRREHREKACTLNLREPHRRRASQGIRTAVNIHPPRALGQKSPTSVDRLWALLRARRSSVVWAACRLGEGEPVGAGSTAVEPPPGAVRVAAVAPSTPRRTSMKTVTTRDLPVSRHPSRQLLRAGGVTLRTSSLGWQSCRRVLTTSKARILLGQLTGGEGHGET
jgi:hypothetical protein